MIAAQVLNVSDGGLAVRLLDKARLHGPVTVKFSVPGENAITAMATVAWSTEPIFGLKFFAMDDASRSAYVNWLASMALV